MRIGAKIDVVVSGPDGLQQDDFINCHRPFGKVADFAAPQQHALIGRNAERQIPAKLQAFIHAAVNESVCVRSLVIIIRTQLRLKAKRPAIYQPAQDAYGAIPQPGKSSLCREDGKTAPPFFNEDLHERVFECTHVYPFS